MVLSFITFGGNILNGEIIIVIFLAVLFDFMYFKTSILRIRLFIYALLALLCVGYARETLFTQTVCFRYLALIPISFFTLGFPFNRILEEETQSNFKLFCRSNLLAMIVMALLFNHIPVWFVFLSVFGFIAMLHTEVRARYIVVYSSMIPTYLSSLIDNDFMRIGLNLSICILVGVFLRLINNPKKSEYLVREIDFTRVLKGIRFSLIGGFIFVLSAYASNQMWYPFSLAFLSFCLTLYVVFQKKVV